MDYVMPVRGVISAAGEHMPYAAHEAYRSFGSGPLFWWLDQPFGFLIFIMVFLTWGLIIIALALAVALMLKKLMMMCQEETKPKAKLGLRRKK